jgi:epoxyqueuosine reductase QueG
MKKELTAEDEALIKKVGFICGCDCCTDCCPMNRHADGTGLKEFKESAKPVYTPGMDLSDRSYGWKPANVERNYKIITED